jgi:hypothetical protein
MGIFYTIHQIEHHNIINAGTSAYESHDKFPCEWMKLDLNTLEKATQGSMAMVIDVTNRSELPASGTGLDGKNESVSF